MNILLGMFSIKVFEKLAFSKESLSITELAFSSSVYYEHSRLLSFF